jgi:hypothetical protein
MYHCPGCQSFHYVPVRGDQAWGFNDNFEKPTLTPSVLLNNTQRICHHFIRDGKIELLTDSSHGVHGVFELEPVEKWAKPWMYEKDDSEKVSS